ncbi:hypothetical protein [Amnibacterium kyonggiense]|uniref:Uncharacterized protein n=1 Tax=Amnibacterium kyonggiense TaxID=595671 RepID=A0A4R7FT54_9MICO|nr:hypothetical protein [Amnibacterium kyonggiense]TDS81075.1 hypothetical protein CLV52_1649 [Amnibacterium kyonggiense]
MEDDRLDPRFASAVRGVLLDEVRGTPPLRTARPVRAAARRPRWHPVLALGIAAGLIVAIAIGFSVASQTRSSPPATQPLHGDCAEILTSRAASELIGKPLRLVPATSALSAPQWIAVPVVGGLQCTWAGVGGVEDASGITLTVLPATARPKQMKADTGCFG